MTDRRPTFDNRRDRVVYLLAEYKLLLGLLFVAAGLVVGLTDAKVSVPPWVWSVAAAAALLAVPGFIAGKRVAEWLRKRNWVDVHHINAVEDTVEKWQVPPRIWEEKTVEGPPPWPVNGSSAWAVREFDWQEGTDRLTVRGVWLSELSDDKLYTSQQQVKDLHGWMLQKYLELLSLRDRVSKMALEVEEDTINASAEAMEKGTMLEADSVKTAWEEAKSDVEDLSDEDMPTVEDVELPGELTGDPATNGHAEQPDHADAPTPQGGHEQ